MGRRLPKEVRYNLLLENDFKCQICGSGGRLSNLILEVHHIIPVSKGGSDERDNLQVLCVVCHDIIHYGRHTGRDITFKKKKHK